MTKIAIIGAMDCEIELLQGLFPNNKIDYKFQIKTGNINNNEIIIAKSGVGKTAAAACTQYIIDTFAPDYIINTGVAGGIGSDLKIKDIGIADNLIHHDFDITAWGYAKGYISNGINPDRPTTFKTDVQISKFIKSIAEKIHSENCVHVGTVVSGDQFIHRPADKIDLKQTFDALATDMEATSIAHVATLNNVPVAVIRTIADLADGTKTDDFGEFEHEAAKISAQIVKEIINSNF